MLILCSIRYAAAIDLFVCSIRFVAAIDSFGLLSIRFAAAIDYVRMFHSIGWKNIPESQAEISDKDKKYYDKIVVAIYNWTHNTPSRIRNYAQFVTAVREEGCYRECKEFIQEMHY